MHAPGDQSLKLGHAYTSRRPGRQHQQETPRANGGAKHRRTISAPGLSLGELQRGIAKHARFVHKVADGKRKLLTSEEYLHVRGWRRALPNTTVLGVLAQAARALVVDGFDGGETIHARDGFRNAICQMRWRQACRT